MRSESAEEPKHRDGSSAIDKNCVAKSEVAAFDGSGVYITRKVINAVMGPLGVLALHLVKPLLEIERPLLIGGRLFVRHCTPPSNS